MTHAPANRPAMPTPEQLQQLIAPLFPGLMGVEIVEATTDKVVATLLVRSDLCTWRRVPRRRLHGLRRHRGCARHHREPAAQCSHHHPSESKTNFLGPAPVNTRITAEATPLHRGKTTQVWQTTIRSEAGNCARSSPRRRWCCRREPHGTSRPAAMSAIW